MSCFQPRFIDKCVSLDSGQIVMKVYPNADDRLKVLETLQVPCGKCIGCRLDYARHWAERCWCESQLWPQNWFLTLTYDDEHLPTDGSLQPKEVQDYLKRLRESYRDRGHTGIRFFMCGEYGGRTFRPHYHILGFNLPLSDLTFYRKSELGDAYYNSASLSKLWDKGFTVVGELTPQSAAYVARYVQKKAEKQIDYDALGVYPEYIRMSRRPGIGFGYLEKLYEKIYDNDKIYLPDGVVVRPSRYFDNHAQAFGVPVFEIKERRKEIALLDVQNADPFTDTFRFASEMSDIENEFSKKVKILKRIL